MDPRHGGVLESVSQSAGGAILNMGNEILGYPVFASTNVKAQTVVADTYFSGITDADDTLSITTHLLLGRFGLVHRSIQRPRRNHRPVHVEPQRSHPAYIMDYYADGNVRRGFGPSPRGLDGRYYADHGVTKTKQGRGRTRVRPPFLLALTTLRHEPNPSNLPKSHGRRL